MTTGEKWPSVAAGVAKDVIKHAFSRRQQWLIGLGVMVVLFGTLVFFSTRASRDLRLDSLSSTHAAAVDELTACKHKIAQAAQLTESEEANADKVLGKIVGGGFGVGPELRYEEMWQATKAYRALDPDSQQRMLLTAVDCQDEFMRAQHDLYDQLGDFEQWRQETWFIQRLGGGFPEADMYISQPGFCLRGSQAFAAMSRPITSLARETRWDTKPDNTPGCS
jgi:hypothetical protein